MPMIAMSASTIKLELQLASRYPDHPPLEQMRAWVQAVLQAHQIDQAELTLRLVDEDEMRAYNHRFRHQNKTTNILSFPFQPPPQIQSDYLGDLLICVPVLHREAALQNKALEHHWAHLIVHGTLHLLGYDHIEPEEAEEMEALEIQILKQFNIANPYETLRN